MKKSILLFAFLGAVTLSASAQSSANTSRPKTVIIKECSYTAPGPVSPQTSTNSESNNILDTLQKQSENTVVYPLVRMAQMVRAKIESVSNSKKRHNRNKKEVTSNKASI